MEREVVLVPATKIATLSDSGRSTTTLPPRYSRPQVLARTDDGMPGRPLGDERPWNSCEPAALPARRLDHGTQRLLLQVHKLRRHLGLQLSSDTSDSKDHVGIRPTCSGGSHLGFFEARRTLGWRSTFTAMPRLVDVSLYKRGDPRRNGGGAWSPVGRPDGTLGCATAESAWRWTCGHGQLA